MGKIPSKKVPTHKQPVSLWFNKPAGILLLSLALFTLTVWVFFTSVHNDFQMYDENGELIVNQHVNSGLRWQNLPWAFASLEYSNWYPLTWISHMLDYTIYGKDPRGHHLTNVLLHGANGVLLFLVLKRMTGALWRSLIVAALFALHPLRVESVAWISERKDVLSAFFGLLAMWAYGRYAGNSESGLRKAEANPPKLWSFLSSPFYWLCLFFFACGLMSKSMVVTFPCLLLLLDFWPLRRIRNSEFGVRNSSRLLLEKIPLFLLVIPVSIVVFCAQRDGGQFMLRYPLDFRLETALMGYARYLGKMFWPVNFSVLYPYPDHWQVGELLLAGALVLGMSAPAVVLWRTRPYLLVGWLWYLGMLLPVIGLIPLGAQSMSNRYTYLPMIGILLLLVWAIHDLTKSWRRQTILMSALVALVMGVCALRTRAEIAYWKDSETLWRRAIAVTQDNFMAHCCLATYLYVSQPDVALVEYQKSVDINPDYEEAQREFAGLLVIRNRFSEAIPHCEKAIQLNPRGSWNYMNLGYSLYKLGWTSNSIPLLVKAIEIDPLHTFPKRILDEALCSSQANEAATSLLATARADPAAFARFLDALQFDTNHVALINNCASRFAIHPDPHLRNGAYAVRLARRACEMTGYRTNICVITLAAAYAEDSRFDEAITNAELACSLASAAGQEAQLKDDQILLDLFRSHKPYHLGAK